MNYNYISRKKVARSHFWTAEPLTVSTSLFLLLEFSVSLCAHYFTKQEVTKLGDFKVL